MSNLLYQRNLDADDTRDKFTDLILRHRDYPLTHRRQIPVLLKEWKRSDPDYLLHLFCDQIKCLSTVYLGTKNAIVDALEFLKSLLNGRVAVLLVDTVVRQQSIQRAFDLVE